MVDLGHPLHLVLQGKRVPQRAAERVIVERGVPQHLVLGGQRLLTGQGAVAHGLDWWWSNSLHLPLPMGPDLMLRDREETPPPHGALHLLQLPHCSNVQSFEHFLSLQGSVSSVCLAHLLAAQPFDMLRERVRVPSPHGTEQLPQFDQLVTLHSLSQPLPPKPSAAPTGTTRVDAGMTVVAGTLATE